MDLLVEWDPWNIWDPQTDCRSFIDKKLQTGVDPSPW